MTEIVFYDSRCALCHRLVRLALWLDQRSSRFRFAPLHGETFRALFPAQQAASFPESMLVRRSDGVLLDRSRALLHILRRTGHGWLAGILALLPRRWADAAYDFVAERRGRFFAPPAGSCPVTPPELRNRFLD